MDKPIVDNRLIKPKHWKFIIGGVALLTLLAALVFRDTSSTLKVEKDKVSVEPVIYGPFQDYIMVVGQVEPISYLFLDAVEGGMVDEVLIEEGSMVNKGDVILKLNNNNLNLSILESEAQLAEKANFLRETQINMEQQKLTLQRDLLQLEHEMTQKKRTYEQNKELLADELVSREEFQRSKEDYELAVRLKKLNMERYHQDSIFRKTQIEKITQNLHNMQRNLELIYLRQENLNVKAPVDGQLGMLDAKPGQSINMGQRIGQVNVLTAYKIKADIDEHYIDRIKRDLSATLVREKDTFSLQLTKVYPEVRDGRFKVDLIFVGKQPQNMRAGLTYHLSLQLGETQQALQVRRGGFFQSTGGQWIYVLMPDGQTAVKRKISIGRQNPQYFEVQTGLEAGEKVITSGYDLFGDNDKLVLQ